MSSGAGSGIMEDTDSSSGDAGMGSRAAEVFLHFSGPRYMYFFNSIGNTTPAGP